MSGLMLWLYQYNHTGPRLTDVNVAVMRRAFADSMARRAGFVPAALAVDIHAADPELTDEHLPLQRLRIPAGCAAFVLEHELES
jgi:hypothetical protein